MMMRILILTPFFAAMPALAQERMDAHGDPLPAGAYARLGTDRGTHVFGWRSNAALAPDGRVLLRQGNGTLYWIDPVSGRKTGTVYADDRDGSGDPVDIAADGGRGVFSWNDHGRVYDLKTGKRLATIPATTKLHPESARISANGEVVAVGQGRPYGQPLADGVFAIVWDVDGDRELCRVKVAEKGTAALALTPDGKTLLTRNSHMPFGMPLPEDAKITKIWDALDGKALGKLEAEGKFYTFAFAKDSKLGAAWDPDAKTIEVFDPRTGKRVRKLSDPAVTGPGGIVFSPDSKTLLVVDYATYTAVEWDIATGRVVKSTKRPADLPEKGFIRGVRYTAAGKPLAWGVWDRNTALAWDPLDGKALTPAVRHIDVVTGVAFTADGRQVLTTDGAGVNLRWDVATGKSLGPVRVEPESPDGPPPVLKPSPDATLGYSVRMAYDLDTGKKGSAYPNGLRFFHPSAGVRPAPGGKVILLTRSGLGAEAAGRCMVCDAATGKAVIDVPLPAARGGYGEEYSAALSPDGTTLVVGLDKPMKPDAKEGECTLLAWDVATKTPKWDRTLPGSCTNVKICPDGKSLAAVVRRRIEALDLATGKTLGGFGGDAVSLFAPVFTPDGTHCVMTALENLAKGGQRIELEIRAWPSGEIQGVLSGRDFGGAAAISPDGTRLATMRGSTVLLFQLPKPK